mmetsp:Transcript_130232/g.309008  ORF Transcript_130232/g.309008 Transcript_130232/m.309008 type:complete len:360 (+) Transcript_130232:585-1664(+)
MGLGHTPGRIVQRGGHWKLQDTLHRGHVFTLHLLKAHAQVELQQLLLLLQQVHGVDGSRSFPAEVVGNQREVLRGKVVQGRLAFFLQGRLDLVQDTLALDDLLLCKLAHGSVAAAAALLGLHDDVLALLGLEVVDVLPGVGGLLPELALEVLDGRLRSPKRLELGGARLAHTAPAVPGVVLATAHKDLDHVVLVVVACDVRLVQLDRVVLVDLEASGARHVLIHLLASFAARLGRGAAGRLPYGGIAGLPLCPPGRLGPGRRLGRRPASPGRGFRRCSLGLGLLRCRRLRICCRLLSRLLHLLLRQALLLREDPLHRCIGPELVLLVVIHLAFRIRDLPDHFVLLPHHHEVELRHLPAI